MATRRFATHNISVTRSTTKSDGSFHLDINYVDANDYSNCSEKIVIGGIPLSLSYLTNGLLSSDGSYKRTYAIKVIEESSISPVDVSAASEYSTVWDGIRFSLSQDQAGRLYLDVNDLNSTVVETDEIIVRGMPLTLGENQELLFLKTALTSADIEEYGNVYIGGTALVAGRVGNNWYLVLHPA